jgi:hypothetical protein
MEVSGMFRTAAVSPTERDPSTYWIGTGMIAITELSFIPNANGIQLQNCLFSKKKWHAI